MNQSNFCYQTSLGQAIISPACLSILSDYFPIHQRAQASGIYSIGVYLGGLVFFWFFLEICISQIFRKNIQIYPLFFSFISDMIF